METGRVVDARSVSEQFEALAALVGTGRSTLIEPYEMREFRRFEVAAGIAPCDGSAFAPLLFLAAQVGWDGGVPSNELRADGTSGHEIMELPLSNLRLVGGGQSIDFFSDLLAGEPIEVDIRLESAELTEGRDGPIAVLKIVKRFTEATSGRRLMDVRESFLAR